MSNHTGPVPGESPRPPWKGECENKNCPDRGKIIEVPANEKKICPKCGEPLGYPKSKIEELLAEALKGFGIKEEDWSRNHEIKEEGILKTVPDFAWPDVKLAVYCYVYKTQCNKDTKDNKETLKLDKKTLELNTNNQNYLRSKSWYVLPFTFWREQNPENHDKNLDKKLDDYALQVVQMLIKLRLKAAIEDLGVTGGQLDCEIDEQVPIPDLAWPDDKLAVYCYVDATHDNKETSELDTKLKSKGWVPLPFTFWREQNPENLDKKLDNCARKVVKELAKCRLEAALKRLDVKDGLRDYEIPESEGEDITPDLAWPDDKLAVYCYDDATHGNQDTLELNAMKLKSIGWEYLPFWIDKILENPDECARKVVEMLKKCRLKAAIERLGVREGKLGYKICDKQGKVVAEADLAWPDVKLAVYCYDDATHGNQDTLKLNEMNLKSIGWEYLPFWGGQVLENPDECARKVVEKIEEIKKRRHQLWGAVALLVVLVACAAVAYYFFSNKRSGSILEGSKEVFAIKREEKVPAAQAEEAIKSVLPPVFKLVSVSEKNAVKNDDGSWSVEYDATIRPSMPIYWVPVGPAVISDEKMKDIPKDLRDWARARVKYLLFTPDQEPGMTYYADQRRLAFDPSQDVTFTWKIRARQVQAPREPDRGMRTTLVKTEKVWKVENDQAVFPWTQPQYAAAPGTPSVVLRGDYDLVAASNQAETQWSEFAGRLKSIDDQYSQAYREAKSGISGPGRKPKFLQPGTGGPTTAGEGALIGASGGSMIGGLAGGWTGAGFGALGGAILGGLGGGLYSYEKNKKLYRQRVAAYEAAVSRAAARAREEKRRLLEQYDQELRQNAENRRMMLSGYQSGQGYSFAYPLGAPSYPQRPAYQQPYPQQPAYPLRQYQPVYPPLQYTPQQYPQAYPQPSYPQQQYPQPAYPPRQYPEAQQAGWSGNPR